MSAEDSKTDTVKPLPRRAFDLNTPTSIPSTPAPEQTSFNGRASTDGSTTPARTRSILNLTSSTLFGIYSDTDYTAEREEPTTPWGTGAQTPVDGRKGSLDLLRNSIPDAFSNTSKQSRPRRKELDTTRKRPHHVRKGFRGYWLPLLATVAALFSAGMLYGVLVSHLHRREDIAPVKVEGIDHDSWEYLIFWGFAGVVLGYALPAVDAFWSGEEEPRRARANASSRLSGSWNDVVRSVGAFVGIAFAIRKLPWQSTLQLSLTLALANPALWYLIDRSVPGFLVSSAVAIAGTALLLGINPGLVPSPATHLPTHIVKRMGHNVTSPVPAAEYLVLGVFSEESVGVTTWIASVLFVSAVCFGNIGRRLALQK